MVDLMQKEEYGNTNIIYNEKRDTLEAHLVQLEVFVEKNKKEEELLYVRESALYILGDRNLATSPSSNRLLIISKDYLGKLIEFYEKNNPSIVVQVVKCPISEFVYSEVNKKIKRDVLEIIDKNNDKIKNKKELNELINKAIDKYDLNILKKELLDLMVKQYDKTNMDEAKGKKM